MGTEKNKRYQLEIEVFEEPFVWYEEPLVIEPDYTVFFSKDLVEYNMSTPPTFVDV